jgi:signal transduction histidine kinase/CheY-like chemotaxis protein
VLNQDNILFEYKENKFRELLYLADSLQQFNNILFSERSIWVAFDGLVLHYDHKGNLLEKIKVPFKEVMDWYLEGTVLKGYARSQQDSSLKFSKSLLEPFVMDRLHPFSKEMQQLNEHSLLKRAPNGLLWYNDNSSAKMYNSEGQMIYDFSEHLPDRSIHKVFSVFFDNNNGSWVNTTNGVFLLTIQPNKFYSYLYKDKFVPGSKSYSVRGMNEDNKGFLYVNTYSGRQKINLKTGLITHIVGAKPELDIYKDKDSVLWFSGQNDYVEKLDLYSQKKEEVLFDRDEDEPARKPMNIKFYRDSYARMWIGTSKGVYYYDKIKNLFVKAKAKGIFIALNSSSVYSFVEDRLQQNLYLGTSSGIYQYNYNRKTFTRVFNSSQKGKYYIPHDYIYCLHKDKDDDNYWIGTNEGGLIKWNPINGKYDQFTVANDMSDNVIYGILEDDNGYLWMSSNYGIMRFNKLTSWFNTYLSRDGVTNDEFNFISYYKSPSGRFYFGGVNGIVAFNPNDFIKKEATEIPLHVISYGCLKRNGESLEDRTVLLNNTNQIILAPDDNYFRLSFSMLDYRNPMTTIYAYNIEGSASGWQYTNDNEIRINRLPYGKYTLIIKAQNFEGQDAGNKLSIPIEVNVPFYKTLNFMIWMAVLFAGLVLLGVRLLIKNSDKNKRYLEQKIASRTQKLLEREQDLLKAKEEAEKSSHAKAEFLSIMSHEIRTPMNAVVNLTNYLIEDYPSEHQIENLNILKFSANNLLAIINDVLDFNKIELGKVDFERIEFDLLGLLDSIHYSMNVNAKKKKIGLFLDADIPLVNLLIGDPNRLTQILNNLVSNAIKFTEKGKVTICLSILNESYKDVQIKFEVIDTGIGIEDSQIDFIFNMFTQAASNTTRKYGGTGLGLAITKRLLQLQNSDIQLKSVIEKGSNFFFVLNFKKGVSINAKRVLGIPREKNAKSLTDVRVLVVEDNEVNVIVVKKFLKKWGVDFAHASDGLKALEKVKEKEFDIILMDIHMPNMDGYSATKAIRKLPGEHYKKIPIIALTASALMDHRGRIYDAGMDDIVVKPFNPAELYDMMSKYL